MITHSTMMYLGVANYILTLNHNLEFFSSKLLQSSQDYTAYQLFHHDGVPITSS